MRKDIKYFKPGDRVKFNYPEEFTTLPEYSKYRGEEVTVIRTVPENEVDPENYPMYVIEAKDGWLGQAFWEELEEINK